MYALRYASSNHFSTENHARSQKPYALHEDEIHFLNNSRHAFRGNEIRKRKTGQQRTYFLAAIFPSNAVVGL